MEMEIPAYVFIGVAIAILLAIRLAKVGRRSQKRQVCPVSPYTAGQLHRYVSIPLLRNSEQDPVLLVIIEQGRRALFLLPTPKGWEKAVRLSPHFLSEEIWQQLEQEARERPGMSLHA